MEKKYSDILRSDIKEKVNEVQSVKCPLWLFMFSINQLIVWFVKIKLKKKTQSPKWPQFYHKYIKIIRII